MKIVEVNRPADDQLIVNEILRTIFPHLSVSRQLEILLKLPSPISMFLNIQGTFKQPETKQLENVLRQATQSSNTAAIERILFLASVRPTTLTPVLRETVKTQLTSSSTAARNIAFDVIRRSEDVELNDYVLDQANSDAFNPAGSEDFYSIQAVTKAVIRSARADCLHLVPYELRQAAAAQMGNDAIASVTEEIGRSVRRLLDPMSPEGQLRFPIIVDATSDGFMQRVNLSHQADEDGLAGLVAPDASARRFEETQRRRRDEHAELTQRLAREGAEALLAVPRRNKGGAPSGQNIGVVRPLRRSPQSTSGAMGNSPNEWSTGGSFTASAISRLIDLISHSKLSSTNDWTRRQRSGARNERRHSLG